MTSDPFSLHFPLVPAGRDPDSDFWTSNDTLMAIALLCSATHGIMFLPPLPPPLQLLYLNESWPEENHAETLFAGQC